MIFMGDLPFVSIIIPCRNERDFIVNCLESVSSCEYPKDRMEVLVVDGMSDDGTRGLIGTFARRYPFLKLKMLNNEKKTVPAALNKGIGISKGEIVLRMDAHNTYDKLYIKKCVEGLARHNADNIGGIWITLPQKDALIPNSIAIGLSHPFGIGNAGYRLGSKKIRSVDTVPFGCYRRDLFEKIGMFDEDLTRNQDDEFNSRLIKNGGRIILDPDIISYYYARDSIGKLWKTFYQYGYFKPLVAKKTKKIATFRQLAPVFFAGGLLSSSVLSLISSKFEFLFLLPLISIYVLTGFCISIMIAFGRKNLWYLFSMPLIFFVLHTSYGAGYLKGALDFLILNKNRKKSILYVEISR